MADKKWYDDWKLSLSTSDCDEDTAIVQVFLPNTHKSLNYAAIAGPRENVQQIANLFDKLLCELTNTKTNLKLKTPYGVHTDLST